MTDTTTSALTIVDTNTLDHDQWLHARRSGIGGSDAAAICGLDPYRSPFSVWIEKTATTPPEDTAGEAALWGTLLEPVVRDEVERRSDGLVIIPEPRLLAHPDHLHMRANLDGAATFTDRDGVGVYEGKTGGVWTAADWDDDQIPAKYLVQIMHYLAVTGWNWAICAVLIGGQRLEVRWVERDEDLIESLVDIEAEFWRQVEDLTPPPLDGTDATTDLLGRLYQPVPGKNVTVDPDQVHDLIAARQAAADAEKTAKEEKDRCSNELRVLLGDATDAVTPDGDQLYTWRPQDRTTIDSKRLKSEQPDTWAEFSKTSTSRVLRIKKAK